MNNPRPRFETLMERHHDEIYSYLWRLMNSASRADCALDAEDLTQEVFLRAYRAFERLRPDSNYRAWLYKIASNCAFTTLKNGSRRNEHNVARLEEAAEAPDESPSPEQAASLSDTLAALHRTIAVLPVKQRLAVIMRHVQRLEYGEIAQALGCSEDSARANVYQAVRRLRREMVGVVDQARGTQREKER